MSGQPTQNQGFQPVGLWSNLFPGYYNNNQQPTGSLNPQQQLALQLQLQAQAQTAQMQQPAKSESRSGSAYASRHQAAEQRRRTRINERLDKLRELVPHAERANTAAFLETVIEYVQELQALLKCGPAHAGGKGGPGGNGQQGFTSSVAAAGSGPYGVATPGGGFEVLPQPQQPGGGGGGNNNAGVNSTGPTSLGLPAGNPFFNNNAGGTNSAFQSAAGMLQGGGHAFFTPQQQPQQGPQPGQGQQQGQQPNGSSASAVFAHHAFANPQQLAGSPGGQQGPGGQAGALSQFDSSTAQAVHQMLAQHAAAQNRNSTNSGSGGVPPIDQLYNLHAPPQLNVGGSGNTSQPMPGLDTAAMITSLQQAQGAQQAQNNASAAPSLAPISGPSRPASATPCAVRSAPTGVKPESPASGGSGGDGSDADGEDGNRKRGPGTPTKGGDGESGLTGGPPKRRRTPSRPRS